MSAPRFPAQPGSLAAPLTTRVPMRAFDALALAVSRTDSALGVLFESPDLDEAPPRVHDFLHFAHEQSAEAKRQLGECSGPFAAGPDEYRQWREALIIYRDALRNCVDHDEYLRTNEREDDGERDRLADILDSAEQVVMALPSPGPDAFAEKYLIANDAGRDIDLWDDLLCVEARHFAQRNVAAPWSAAHRTAAARAGLECPSSDGVTS